MNSMDKELVERIKAKMLAMIFSLDLFVGGAVVVGVGQVEGFDAVYAAQLLRCMRVSGGWGGLLINFNEPTLGDGLKRYTV